MFNSLQCKIDALAETFFGKNEISCSYIEQNAAEGFNKTWCTTIVFYKWYGIIPMVSFDDIEYVDEELVEVPGGKMGIVVVCTTTFYH